MQVSGVSVSPLFLSVSCPRESVRTPPAEQMSFLFTLGETRRGHMTRHMMCFCLQGLSLPRWCQQGALCGILHHRGRGNVYGLLVQLTHSGGG
ncbi:hypothetical protein CgunFtcFv8_027585 [Champsocephalus gunnari]|uniref:Uncharacterized protein n=1 Tax=Champsocephalus gunnari TaxID=52237 RepID=A0AAN8DYB6_CHAGU|nr:hypothetical protein CgunFtcFv8_027585 [Champsocephalus gunnari]